MDQIEQDKTKQKKPKADIFSQVIDYAELVERGMPALYAAGKDPDRPAIITTDAKFDGTLRQILILGAAVAYITRDCKKPLAAVSPEEKEPIIQVKKPGIFNPFKK